MVKKVQVDWLSIYQDHAGMKLPLVGKEIGVHSNIETGEITRESISPEQKTGSFDSKLTIRCNGSRVSMSGNPSRWMQKDSLFGTTSVIESISIFNAVLKELGLPQFTENSMQQPCNQRVSQTSDIVFRDGAVITRVDDATNFLTGSVQNGKAIIQYLASQRHQGRTGHVYPNGCTVDWQGRSSNGKGSRYVYFKYYAKWVEAGCSKKDPDYYFKLMEWCKDVGLIRFEISLKSQLLKREGLDSINAWHTENINKIRDELREKYMMHKKTNFSVTEFSKISEELMAIGETGAISAKAQGLVDSWTSGNMYYMDDNVMSKTSRYRYRSLIKKVSDIDILEPLNVTRLPVKLRTIELSEATPPEWYSRIAL